MLNYISITSYAPQLPSLQLELRNIKQYCIYEVNITIGAPNSPSSPQGRIFRILNGGLPEEWPLDGGCGIHLKTALLNDNLKIH